MQPDTLTLRRGIDHGPQRRDPRVPGPQEAFLASTADICIYGGAGGGGKTWANAYDPLRHVSTPGYRALFVREYALDIRTALWPEMEGVYPLLGGVPNRNDLKWTFPSGATIECKAVDGDFRKRFRGPQWAAVYFEEIADIGEDPFWFIFGRNRTAIRGLKSYMRGTCNPDADSWLAEFLSWWWDPATGFALPERAGLVRWMAKDGDDIHWGDSPAEILRAHPRIERAQCKSVQFIPAKLSDNAFLGADYRGNLLSQDEVQRARLLEGNWLARYEKGKVFRREWLRKVPAIEVPADVVWCRAWDLAATPEADTTSKTSHSYTAGAKWGWSPSQQRIYIGHMVHGRWDSGDVERKVVSTAKADGDEVKIWICRERGGAGKSQLGHYVRLLNGYEVDGDVESGEKTPRLGPLAAQAKHGNVYLVEDDADDPWNEKFLRIIENLPARESEDLGDASAAAYDRLVLVESYTGAQVAAAMQEDAATMHEVSAAFDFSGSSRSGGW